MGDLLVLITVHLIHGAVLLSCREVVDRSMHYHVVYVALKYPEAKTNPFPR